jgi:eukaryotic-like serine/threonine-protein kinase
LTTDETRSLPPEEEFALWLAACDERLAAGGPVVPPEELGAPGSMRERLERNAAWCLWLRQNWPQGAPSLLDPFPSTPDDRPPTSGPSPKSFGRFLLQQELGRGSFGVVYQAYDPQLRRELALKVPRAEISITAELRTRFEHEAMAAAGLDHPHIVPVFEAGVEGSVCFIASAYCAGCTLAAWLRRRTRAVPYRLAAGLVRPLAEAIEHAHRRGVLHRDLKPSNILLEEPTSESSDAPSDRDDSDLVLRITDFGLAKLLDAGPGTAAAPNPTLSGVILGTPNYMAPEQADGRSRAVGPAADIYSLGAILYEILTGRPPLQADSALETLVLVRTQDPIPPSRLRPGLPRDLETIVLKCLEKDPRRRYESAGELADELRRFSAGEAIRARPTPAWERVFKWVKRRPTVAALAAVTGLATLVLVAVILTANARLQQGKEFAEAKRLEAEAQSQEARTQRRQALANLRLALQAVDQMLTRLGYERLAEVPHTEPLRRDLLQDALKFYQEFARQRSDDPELALVLAQAHVRLARNYVGFGDIPKLEQTCRRAIELLENPDMPFPDLPARDRELAGAYLALSTAFMQSGRMQESEAALQRALALLERLVATHPDDILSRSKLAETQNRLGMQFFETHRLAEAERSFRKANQLREELIERYPDVLDHRRQLALSRQNLAVVFSVQKRFAEAESLLRLSLDVYKELAVRQPQTSDFLSKQALVYRNLHDLYKDTGRWAEAEEVLCRAAELRRKMLEIIPSDAHQRAELGDALAKMADCALRRGDMTEGRRLVDEAISHTRQAVDANPENPTWLGRLRDEHASRAEVCVRLGNPDEAAQAVTALTKVPSTGAQDWLRAGSILARCAILVDSNNAMADDRRRQQSRAYADQAIKYLRQAVRNGYRDRAFLDSDPSLTVLRPRNDFKQLLDGIVERGQPR